MKNMTVAPDTKILRTIDEMCAIPEGSLWLTDGRYRPGLVEGFLLAWPAERSDEFLRTTLRRLARGGVRISAACLQALSFGGAADEGYGPGARGFWTARFAESPVRVVWDGIVYDPVVEAARMITASLDDRTGTVPLPPGFEITE
jgi:hypothetical protein